MHPYITVFHSQIPTYGAMLTLGLIVAVLFALRRVRAAGRGWENFTIILATAFGTGIMGAMTLYVFVTYSWQQLLSALRQGTLGQLFTGLVFYGGAIGGALGAALGANIAHASLPDYLDDIVPMIPLAHALGRVGCFCAGCCYGRPTDSALGVIFPANIGGAPTGIPLLPVQLFEALGNLAIFVALALLTRRTQYRIQTLCLYAALYSILRFALEFLRYDSIRGIWSGLSTSQWISVAIILAVGAYEIYSAAIKPHLTSRAK